MIGVDPEVVRLLDEGRDVGEIAHQLGMSRYAVRRMADQLDPPIRSTAPLIPPPDSGALPTPFGSANIRRAAGGEDEAIRKRAENNRLLTEFVEKSRRIQDARRGPCGTESAWKRHRKYWQTCATCDAAHQERKAGRTK